MNVQALYVYKTTEFEIDRGVIEPLLLASGEPVGDVIRQRQTLAPGLYRVPAATQFHPVNGGDFETQDDAGSSDPNDVCGKDCGLPDPPKLAIALLALGNESPEQVTARIKARLEGAGEKSTI